MLPAIASTAFSTAYFMQTTRWDKPRFSFYRRGHWETGIKQLAPPPLVETAESNPAFNGLGGLVTRSNLSKGHIYLIQLNTAHRTGMAEGREGLRGLGVKTLSSIAVSRFCLFPPASLGWTVWLSRDYVTCNTRPTKKRQTGELPSTQQTMQMFAQTQDQQHSSHFFLFWKVFFFPHRSALYSSVS